MSRILMPAQYQKSFASFLQKRRPSLAFPACEALSLIPLCLILAAHIGVLSSGEWQKDEFRFITGLRDGGADFFIHRLLTINPRPVSETLLLLYGEMVLWVQRPLIGPFLCAGWIGLLLCCCAPLARAPTAPRLFLGLAVACLFLLGHPLADMFYWPCGMAPYVLTIAALAFATMRMVDAGTGTRSAGRAIAASLCVAAGSSEFGAMVVLPFAAGMLLHERVSRPNPSPTAWLALPLVLALAVLLSVATHRVIKPQTHIIGTYHALWPSLAAALRQMPRVLAAEYPSDGGYGQEGLGSILAGVPLKLLMFSGFVLLGHACLPRARSAPLLILALASVAGVFATLFAAYFQFGFLCCQRQETARQCLLVLAMLASASVLAHALIRWRRQWWHGLAGMACLLLAMAPMAAWRLPDLLQAYATAPAAHAHLAQLWSTGLAAGNGPVVLRQSADPLVHAWTFTPGTHHGGAVYSDVYETLAFFRKSDLVVLPP